MVNGVTQSTRGSLEPSSAYPAHTTRLSLPSVAPIACCICTWGGPLLRSPSDEPLHAPAVAAVSTAAAAAAASRRSGRRGRAPCLGRAAVGRSAWSRGWSAGAGDAGRLPWGPGGWLT
ncbi:hypothetical protein GCM10022416_38360 [Actinomadura keratinilytica]|uniref:Uncharacterized protein n=1 Tax=Actinomadura keratinilytica TaxID=547461 RepID=A0ABP7Z2N7_9ACTN